MGDSLKKWSESLKQRGYEGWLSTWSWGMAWINTKRPGVCRVWPAEPIKLQPLLHPWNTIWGISGEICSNSTDRYEHQQGCKWLCDLEELFSEMQPYDFIMDEEHCFWSWGDMSHRYYSTLHNNLNINWVIFKQIVLIVEQTWLLYFLVKCIVCCAKWRKTFM